MKFGIFSFCHGFVGAGSPKASVPWSLLFYFGLLEVGK
jgi:hypothetical protein